VECGLPIPREAMRLVGDPQNPRLVGNRTGTDFTEQMLDWAERRVAALERENLAGFIFKSGSPSSGMERVKVYDDKGMPQKVGVGLFAEAFKRHFPLLPTEEDGRLHDPGLRENFLERLFAMQRWIEFEKAGPDFGDLVEFHTRHKMLVMSHSQKHYKQMGKLTAYGKVDNFEETLGLYRELFMDALHIHATRGNHANVLQHMLGHFKDQLTPDEKQEMLELVDHYLKGHVPLIVPVTMINHYVRKYDEAYLAKQIYLNPTPIELKLRACV
jgi:uncharacterized protein YbgA (DUF1722 family)